MRRDGFPAYTASAGWLGYSDEKIRALCRQAVNEGWTHVKIKVGRDIEDDLRRARIVREEIGDRLLPGGRVPARRRQRGARRAPHGREVRYSGLPARRRRGALRVRPAHLALRLHRGRGVAPGSRARVRRPPARALRRPGHDQRRPLHAAGETRVQHRDESRVATRVRLPRWCGVVIDAHHHFWDPAKASYPWMTEALAPIRRRFGPEDLQPLLAANGIDRTILVQTRSSIDETREFLATALQHEFIAGVVGWVDLTGDVAKQIGSLRAGPGGAKLVG